MKKSVVLVIFVVYVASIFIVGWYGFQMQVYNPKINVESVECLMIMDDKLDIDTKASTNESYHNAYTNEGIEYIFYRPFYSSDLASGKGLRVDLKFGVLPKDATNDKVEYVVEEIAPDETGYVPYTFTDNGDGSAYFMFYERIAVNVTVKSADNASTAAMKVRVQAIKPRPDR